MPGFFNILVTTLCVLNARHFLNDLVATLFESICWIALATAALARDLPPTSPIFADTQAQRDSRPVKDERLSVAAFALFCGAFFVLQAFGAAGGGTY